MFLNNFKFKKKVGCFFTYLTHKLFGADVKLKKKL